MDELPLTRAEQMCDALNEVSDSLSYIGNIVNRTGSWQEEWILVTLEIGDRVFHTKLKPLEFKEGRWVFVRKPTQSVPISELE